MFDISNGIEKLKRSDKLAVLDREFPGGSCGNTECENLCAEALRVAKAMRLDSKTMLEDSIRQGIAPKTHCVPASAEFTPPFFTAPCRFGFVRPNDHLALSESSNDSSYVFRAKPGSCEKCQSCDGITIPADKMQDEKFMKNFGFWKQKDGVSRPHPNCDCKWEKNPIDYSSFDWEKTASGKLAEYTVKNLPERINKIPVVLQQKLARKVGLDASGFQQWAQDIKFITINKEYAIQVSVPNIWICADLLRGGSWYWDIPIVNWGGTIGQAASYIGTWGMHEIKCRTVAELKAAFNDNRKTVWGFVLYAHGNKTGTISSPTRDAMSQNELMSLVDSQGFKLGKLYLMQCESGAEVERKGVLVPYNKIMANYKNKWETGEISDAFYRKFLSLSRMEILKLAFPEVEKASKEDCAQYPNRIFVRCEIVYPEIVTVYKESWDKDWGNRVVRGEPNISYKGLNIMGIDFRLP